LRVCGCARAGYEQQTQEDRLQMECLDHLN
jgi:hypothetical protein